MALSMVQCLALAMTSVIFCQHTVSAYTDRYYGTKRGYVSVRNVTLPLGRTYVNLQDNKISSLRTGDFEGNGWKGVTRLLLDHNKLECIGKGAFQRVSSLLELSLGYNKIRNISSHAFKKLTNLERLDLSNNELTSIHSRAFGKKPNLTELILRRNRLSFISKSTFSYLGSLEVLDLSYNQLTSIQSNSFVKTPKLRELILRGNNLSIVSNKTLVDFPNLEVLDLADNQFTSIYSHLSVNRLLRKLILRGNRIGIVNNRTFVDLPKLEILDLSHNQLKTINSHSFVKLPKLNRLYLNDNQITTVVYGSIMEVDLDDLYVAMYHNLLAPERVACTLHIVFAWWFIRHSTLTCASARDNICYNFVGLPQKLLCECRSNEYFNGYRCLKGTNPCTPGVDCPICRKHDALNEWCSCPFGRTLANSTCVPAQIKTEKLGEDFVSLALDLKHYIADTTLTSYDIKLVTGSCTFNLKVSSATDVIRINGLAPDTAYTISILNSGFKDVKIRSKPQPSRFVIGSTPSYTCTMPTTTRTSTPKTTLKTMPPPLSISNSPGGQLQASEEQADNRLPIVRIYSEDSPLIYETETIASTYTPRKEVVNEPQEAGKVDPKPWGQNGPGNTAEQLTSSRISGLPYVASLIKKKFQKIKGGKSHNDSIEHTIETSSSHVPASHDMASDSVVRASSPADHVPVEAAASSNHVTARSSEESRGIPVVAKAEHFIKKVLARQSDAETDSDPELYN